MSDSDPAGSPAGLDATYPRCGSVAMRATRNATFLGPLSDADWMGWICDSMDNDHRAITEQCAKLRMGERVPTAGGAQSPRPHIKTYVQAVQRRLEA